MDERKVNIDELFRKRMEGKAETPPPAVWDKLEQRLKAPAPSKKPFPVWWFLTIAVLLIISATVIIAALPGDKQIVAGHPEQKLSTTSAQQGAVQPVSRNNNAVTQTSNEPIAAATTENDINETVIENNTKESKTPSTTFQNNDVITQASDEQIAATRTTNNAPETTANKNTNESKTSDNNVAGREPSGEREQEHTEELAINSPKQVTAAKTYNDKVVKAVPAPPAPRIAQNIPMLPAGQVLPHANTFGNHSPASATVPAVEIKLNEGDMTSMSTRQIAAKDQEINMPAAKQPVVSLQTPIMNPDALGHQSIALTTTVSTENSLPGIAVEDLLAAAKPYPVAPYEPVNVSNNTSSNSRISRAEEEVFINPSRASPDGDTTKKKKISDSSNMNPDVTEQPKEKKERKPWPLEAGVKAGYASGFDASFRANKFAIAPYIEYAFSAKVSLTFQPTYHTGNARVGAFDNGEQAYYEVTGTQFDSTERVVRGVIDSTVVTPNPPDTVYRSYAYTQTYDSVHVSYGVTQRQLWDIEVPLILKYKINDKFAVLAGGSITYSSVLQVEENMQRFEKVNEYSEVTDPQTFYVTSQGQGPPAGPAPKAFSDLFTYTGEPYSSYAPRTITQSNNFFRYGFMIGASATFKERLMIELMLHKTGVDATAVPDKQLQKLYTQPYLRIMVGYKLFK